VKYTNHVRPVPWYHYMARPQVSVGGACHLCLISIHRQPIRGSPTALETECGTDNLSL
jgi:hypothetical protein